MPTDLIPVTIKGMMPTGAGTAVFFKTDEKAFVIHMDPHMGQALAMHLHHVSKERPMTHDLIGIIFAGLGITLEHVVINDIKDSTFYARIILTMTNELGKKMIDLDARPSDAIILALQANKLMYVERKVLSQVEDISDILNKLFEENSSGPEGLEGENLF